MLETKNLRKVYTPKKGVPVTALDGVSLKFPERGMVFLLGKSGSGKSTLLNLLGGLDKYDGGEIVIKGVSSRDFTQERFDSYRNTYVGFIFQDYNILEEFTVGANIALALELQGKKATDAEINRILYEVDLVGYGNRKPNELSGGQLQRVAIARALVKNPEIIMADEPTGALDSATGKQVFDTLKKLSAEKLVIIVSHDREYAEYYADRIIELSDGRVISDVEHTPDAEGATDALTFDGDTVTVPAGYHLTEDDRSEINAYIDRIKSGTRLHFSGLTKKFRDTDTSSIPAQDPSKFALIKSRLPLRSAFRIGGSGLKYKKFRLFMTILLSVVAFTLFALTDTFGAYDHIRTCTNSIVESDISYLSLLKAKKIVWSELDYWWRTGDYKISREELAEIERETGVSVKGVYVPKGERLAFGDYFNSKTEIFDQGQYNIYTEHFTGFVEMTESDISSLGYTISAGRLPDGTKNEIAIPLYVSETFRLGGFATGKWNESTGEPIYDKIGSASDLIGRKLKLAGVEYEIVGIIDTHFDLSRYASLGESSEHDSTSDEIIKYVLWREYSYATNWSFNSAAFVGSGMIDKLIAAESPEIPLADSYFSLNYSTDSFEYYIGGPDYVGRLSDIADKDKIVWADGKPRTELAEGEIVVPSTLINCFKWNYVGDIAYDDDMDFTRDDFDEVFGIEFEGWISSYGSGDENIELSGYRVVGIIDYFDSEEYTVPMRSVYLTDELYDRLTSDVTGEYNFAVGAMPENRGDVESIVRYCYRETENMRYQMQNPVTYELDSVNEVLVVLAKVFLWIGVGFAVFAAIMLANFIGTSIAYKKQEIGILRAIGSRSSDVFNIFFSEGFIIAMINFVIASAATFTATSVINYIIRTQAGILITILSFGIRQLALILVISVGVTAVACFLPVKKIASKRPIDAIRGR